MTDAAHIIRDKLLDAKRHLEKAQSEVDAGATVTVSVLIQAALDDVRDALKASGSRDN